jgi:hypothetical protein
MLFVKMTLRARVFGCVWLVAGMLAVSVASAQDSATAGALFEKGVADMEAGRFDSACPAIAESQRIDPHPGTLFTLAECHARWGKVASAVAQYQEYVDLVSRLTADQQQRHQARVDIARAQLHKLKPSVPTLTLVLPAGAPPGTVVTRNGEMLQGAALGLALPVDPGQYLIVTRVPGGTDRETRVALQLGEQKRVALELSPATPPAVPLAAAAPPSSERDAQANTNPNAPERARGNGRKTAAYVAGGIGLTGVAVGTVTGVLVLGKKQTVNDNCVGSACNDTGLAAATSGQHLATVSNVSFGIGIVGLAASAFMLLTGSPDQAGSEHATRLQPILVGQNGGLSAGVFRRW